MIRFAWLQARTQILIAGGALLVLAIVLAVTGPHIAHLYSTNIVGCSTRGNCDTARAAFLHNDKTLRGWLGILMIVMPGVIGLFWGAPLVARELESGTHRLAWTQSITRDRWLAGKIAVLGLAGMATAGLLSWMIGWWATHFDAVNADRFVTPNFDSRGVVVVGYTAFAFALGVAAGAAIKRVLPAMATVLVLFVTVRLMVIHWIRPHFVAPLRRVASSGSAVVGFGSTNSGAANLIAGSRDMPNAWLTSTRIVDGHGRALTSDLLAKACPALSRNLGPPPAAGGRATRVQADVNAKDALTSCITKVGHTYHAVTTYQPANRYWTFQWCELAFFLVAAAALCGVAFYWVRRRLA